MSEFVELNNDEFRPNYGGINWTLRLNFMLEETGVELIPIGYKETEVMQVTQENTIVYINQLVDEMDCIAIKYHLDPDDMWTWYFVEKFESDEEFRRTVETIGSWATNIVTLYPMEHVVVQYESLQASKLNEVPDWFQ